METKKAPAVFDFENGKCLTAPYFVFSVCLPAFPVFAHRLLRFPTMDKTKATNHLRLIAFVVPITFGRHTYLCYYYTSYYLYYNISLILDLSTFILSETGFRLTLPRDTAHYFSPIRSENRKK